MITTGWHISGEEYGWDFPREILYHKEGEHGRVYVMLPIPEEGTQIAVERSFWNGLSNDEKIAYHREVKESFTRKEEP